MPDIDYAPLTAQPTKEQIAAYRQRAASAAGVGLGAALTGIIVAAVAIVTFAIVMVFAIGVHANVLVFAGVAGVFLAIVLVGSILSRRARIARLTRMGLFAERNGLTFTAISGSAGWAGAIFGVGGARTVYNLFRGERAGRPFEAADYRYTTGSGKDETTHRWGFLTLQLDRNLPHMVLDSTANDGLFGQTDLPVRFARDQVLHLEGDFDRYFRLYCPTQYETDALYVFTPNLMAVLIDQANGFDVEIVDDRMFVYYHGELDLLSPAVWQRLLLILDTVGATTVRQTDRYVDDRVAAPVGASALAAARAGVPDIVAPQGRRLRRGVPVLGTVVVVAVIGYLIVSTFVLH